MGHHLALKKKKMAQKMSITKYASIFSKKWWGRAGDTSLKRRWCDQAGTGMVSARRGALPRWEWCAQSSSASLTDSAAKSITPASSVGSAQDTLGEGNGLQQPRCKLQPHLTPQLRTFTGLKGSTALFTSEAEVCFPPRLRRYLHSAIQQMSVPGRRGGAHH